MIQVTRHIFLDPAELKFEFIRASGPGGQHVNKVASAVQLRFDVRRSSSLPADVRERLTGLAGNRLTADGVLIIEARSHRSQHRNREEAINRLVKLIRRAAEKPRARKKTGIPKSAKKKRLENKRRQGEKKKQRGPVKPPSE